MARCAAATKFLFRRARLTPSTLRVHAGALFAGLQDARFPQAGELFVYSRNDPLCDPAALDAFIAERRLRTPGAAILSQRFESSPHCGHLRQHRRVYVERMKELLVVSINPWRARRGMRPWPASKAASSM